MAKAKIIVNKGSQLTDIADSLHSLHKYCSSHDVGAVALQAHPAAEDYIRSKLGSHDLDLWKAGHYIILMRYCLNKNYTLFCVSRDTAEEDIKAVLDYLPKGKELVAIVEDADFFRKEFSGSGFVLE